MKRLVRPLCFASWAALVFFLGGCSTKPADTSADEQALRTLDSEWVKASQVKSVDRWVAFYSDDAVVLPANEPMARDKAAIRKSIDGLLGLPGADLTWEPARIEVARAGDLAYVYGTYRLSFEEAPGKRTEDRGKVVEIWRKQDGNWKCIVDTWNSDLPAGLPQSASSGD